MAIHLTTDSPRCCCAACQYMESMAEGAGAEGGRGMTYSDLKDELLAIVGGLESVQNGGKLLGVELDCRGASAEGAGEGGGGSHWGGLRYILTIDDGTCGCAVSGKILRLGRGAEAYCCCCC